MVAHYKASCRVFKSVCKWALSLLEIGFLRRPDSNFHLTWEHASFRFEITSLCQRILTIKWPLSLGENFCSVQSGIAFENNLADRLINFYFRYNWQWIPLLCSFWAAEPACHRVSPEQSRRSSHHPPRSRPGSPSRDCPSSSGSWRGRLPNCHVASRPYVAPHRTHDAIITLLWRRTDVAMSFWPHNDVILASCASWVYNILRWRQKWHRFGDDISEYIFVWKIFVFWLKFL